MRLRTLTLLFAAAAGTAIAAGDAAKVTRSSALRAEPFSDAAVVTEVPADSQVSVLERKGGWYKVQAASSQGWMQMTAVRLGTGAASASGSGDSGLGQLVNFGLTGRSGSSGVTAATGIKGWDEQDVLRATPDYRALDEMERLAAGRPEASDFAAKGRLASQQIKYTGAQSARGSSTGGSSMPQKEGLW